MRRLRPADRDQARHVDGAGQLQAARRAAVERGRTALVAVAHAALRHRIFLQFEAEADGVTTDRIISEILEHTVKEPARD